jgi:threonine/homoserine/homoserine lactone efflux protein
VDKAVAILRRPRARQGLELFSGATLVLFGARMVVARR